jgi:tetratricopeptide (TPR) repeat protein
MKCHLRFLLPGICVLVGLGIGVRIQQSRNQGAPPRLIETRLNPAPPGGDPCGIALAPHHGNEKIDLEIERLQGEARSGANSAECMKRLGWAFITKARLSYDPGYYKLAEQCASCAQSKNAHDPDALLLQGHIFQSLHRFKEAERIARRLLTIRGEASDYGLLGDVLMEQGQLTDAAVAYQKMINARPDPQAYARVAHLRWLKGDLEGAIEVMRMAVTAGSPNEPEPTAWCYTRLGLYELQLGEMKSAAKSAATALEFADNYAAALLLNGRILLVEGDTGEALKSLRHAATLTLLPEYQWMLADALREAGEFQAAEEAESKLISQGATTDPRTFALYLATRGRQTQEALKLAEDELHTRTDVFTMDAVAWALKANGRLQEAQEYSRKALSEGTQDARLFYHAGCIALALNDYADAQKSFVRAESIDQMLMPLERVDLEKQFAAARNSEKPDAVARSN